MKIEQDIPPRPEFNGDYFLAFGLAERQKAWDEKYGQPKSNAKNLVEGLTDEILRVTKIETEYYAIPGGAGRLAAMMMGAAIETARKAQASGDIMQMIPALKALQEFEL